MKLFNVAALLASLSTLTLAAPVAGPVAEPVAEPNTLEVRATTAVDLCQNQNFNGPCTVINVGIRGGCYNFPGAYNDKVSSLKTGGPSTQCTFFVGGSCSGDSISLTGPHPTIPGAFNDKLSSVRCP